VVSIVISVVIFLFSLVLAWMAGPVLHVEGTALIILRVLFVLLGVAAAAIILVLHFRKKKREGSTKDVQGNTELDTLLRDAEKKLASAQRTGAKTLDSLPLLYMLGEANAAKTTLVMKSGLDPELLAGQMYRDQDIVPTPVINLWYTQQCVLIEAGDAVRSSPALWAKLIRRTRPKAYRAAMGSQAPIRAAVVCMNCEHFLGASATEAAARSARQTNQMLRDLAQQLGTEIPVYVIFTKLDRVPGFAEYVRNLSNEEASQALGIPTARSGVSSGLYAEQATREVTNGLDQLIFSLAEYRLEILSRENDQRNVDPVYEFPREFRKLRNNLSAYLVELTRPSHLNANPYLRGFYFTGVRAHVLEQMVSAAAAVQQAAPVDAGATRMFSVQQMQAVAAPPTPQVVAQKIAQWTFLPKLFPIIILQDRSALSNTSNSGRTHTFRRILFGTVSALLLIYLLCLIISYGNNSRLEKQISSATQALPARTVPPQTLASSQELSALDQVRAALVQLENYQQNGPPLMYRWGLYHGDSLLESARSIYFDRFQRLLLTNTQSSIVSMLAGLPTAPAAGADYSAAYNPLRAYLITTSNPDKSTPEFLTPVLMQYWLNGKTPETEQQKQLAQQQFDFYANELKRGNPYSIAPAMPAVTRARAYLGSFGGYDRIYQNMLAAANKANPSIDFNRIYPGSSAVVIESHIVPGAFSRNGFTFMQDAIQHPDRYFSGEAWVLGDQAPPSLDRTNLTQQLAGRYIADYLNEWRSFLRQASVVRYGSLQDASGKLQILSNPSSPLLALFYTASHNTAVANPDISKEFQPTQALVPPDSTDRWISQGNSAYINGLVGLQGAVSQVIPILQSDPVAVKNPATVQPVQGAATSAHGAVSQTSQAFNIDPQAHVEQTVIKLLHDPITSTEDAAGRVAGAGQKQDAQAFCAAFNGLMTKFPFSPNSPTEASVGEVAGIFQPGTGRLWQFHESSLKTTLVQQGAGYGPAPGAKVSPAFVRFFNQAAGVSAAFYPAGATSPTLNFTANILPSKGIQSVTLAVDAQRLSGANISKQITWSAQTAQMAQVTANYSSGSLPLQFNGTWALFHLIDKGKVEQAGPATRLAYPLEIAGTPVSLDNTPLVVRIEFSGATAGLLMPGGLSMRCVVP
jgi:type VI secretion system protein ImpL